MDGRDSGLDEITLNPAFFSILPSELLFHFYRFNSLQNPTYNCTVRYLTRNLIYVESEIMTSSPTRGIRVWSEIKLASQTLTRQSSAKSLMPGSWNNIVSTFTWESGMVNIGS